MSENKYNGGEKRLEAYKKLKVFLANPGKFSLIVYGERGTGKHYAIEKAFEEISKEAKEELCLCDICFIESADFPSNPEDINAKFEENKHNTLVIENIEDLTEEQQKLIFNSLSTTDGTFGLGKKFNLRIVFTSSTNIDALRTEKDVLLGYFWDRISQLVVEIPSFKNEYNNIISDFKNTWKKMDYQKIIEYEHFSKLPKNAKLEKFIEDNATKFDGNFRDLDKIACLYFNYRIFHYGIHEKILDEIESKVVDSVKEDFFSKSQLQGNTGNDFSFFEFKDKLNHKELLGLYKIQLRKWALKKYKTIAKAEKELGFKPGTMKNYVEKKVTTSAKKKQTEE